MNKILVYLSYITILSAIALMGVATFWYLYPYKIITFEQPVRVLTPEVKRGEHMTYEVVFCKYTKKMPLITKTFVDGIIYQVPEGVARQNDMGCNTNLVQMYIPKALPAGEFYVEINYRYELNPIRTEDITIQTERFTIL